MRRLSRILRISALLGLVAALSLLWFGRRVLAELSERSLALAPSLAEWTELMGRTTELELNGQRLGLSTMTSEDSPQAVLARFEQLCKQAAPKLVEELRVAQSRTLSPEPFLGVLKQEYGEAGGVSGCIAPRDGAGLHALTSRLGEFLTHRDLGVFGEFRYLIARKSETGGTHALLIYNRGALKLSELLPNRGDAAGGDLQGIPRPDGSVRLLSAQAVGRPYGLVAYTVQESPRAALASYAERLASRSIPTLRVLPEEADEVQLRGAVHGGEPLVVHAFEHGGETVISVVKLGGRLTTQATAVR